MGSQPKAPKETAAERAYADIGAERLEMSRQMRPVREDLFKRITDFRKQKQQIRDRGATDFAVASRPVKEAAAGTGDAGTAARTGLRLAKAAGGNAAATERRAEGAHVTGIQGLTDMALGESGRAIAGMGQIAEQGQQDAITRARAAAARTAATTEAVGSAVGAVAGGIYGAKKPNPQMPATPGGISVNPRPIDLIGG